MDLRVTLLSSLFVFLVTAVLSYGRVTKPAQTRSQRNESQRKSPVFRVTGLLAMQPDDELNTTLRAAIDKNLNEEEKSNLRFSTIVLPSCYGNEQERVALVEFSGGIPTFLSGLVANSLEDEQVEMGSTDISFDCHFFGFTQLYSPKLGSRITAEYVAFLTYRSQC
jgi:hypothetical protein